MMKRFMTYFDEACYEIHFVDGHHDYKSKQSKFYQNLSRRIVLYHA
jgi:hypothetical protein